MEIKMATAILKKGGGKTLKMGGSWIYDNEIESIEGAFANGDIIEVRDFDSYFLGRGYINIRSKIRIRLLTRRNEEIDDAFFEKRARQAWEYRKNTVDTSSCRVIFAEADFLPGLVVDKFEDILVAESQTLGMENLKLPIINALKKVLAEDGINIRGVYERSDARVRELEGLPRFKGFIGEPFDTMVEMTENGIRYIVDVKDGQKTGFFLDQKSNRLAIRPICRGKSVLDCFTHTGSFALNAGIAGASEVLGVDSSEAAIEQARENAKLNGLSELVRFECEDVFELLPRLIAEGRRYDVVILDPPAFTKTKASLRSAIRGYRDINLRGMKLVKNGGFLVTCSCSHFMEPEIFHKTILEAAISSRKRLRQVEFRAQSADHPILWPSDQSYYLKMYILQVLDEA